MRKLLFIMFLIGGMLSIPTTLLADEGQKKTIRLFLNSGDLLDFDAEDIDSITTTVDSQTFWYAGTSRTIAIETIDSIWYISPTLKMTTDGLNFGKVAVGNIKKGYVTLTNTGQYPETYFLMADGIFSTSVSGKNIKINAGEAQSIELTFEPEDSVAYSGNLMLRSNAFENGSFAMPLVGEGIGIDSLEENAILPPAEEMFELELPDNQEPSSLAGFKIINSYGEYPVSTTVAESARRAARAEGKNDYFFDVSGLVSRNWMQGHTFVDEMDNPYLFVITMPGERPKMSIEATAISLLMSEPLLITTNEDEYRNTVACIKSCKKEWGTYLGEVAKMYNEGVKAGLCPNYKLIDTKPLLRALAQSLFDNSELTLSGVSLVDKDIDAKKGKAVFKVHNDLRRTLHIYTSRVRTNDESGAIIAREDVSPTLVDVLGEWLEEYIKEKKNVYQLDEEDKENLKELMDMASELETLVSSELSGGQKAHIHLPIELESQHSNYWKIVKGSWNGDDSSPFAITSDPIEITYEDYDKALIEVYGLGTFNKPWDYYTGEEKLRIIFALLYGGYKDFIKPAIDIAAGINSLDKSLTKAEEKGPYKYDLRYGSRKYPLLMLVVRLGIDLMTEGKDTYDKVKTHLKEGDKLEAARDILEFLYDRICVKPKDESTDSKRSYYNLIYNCYKNFINDHKQSKKFRENFKKMANDLNVLKEAGFIGKVVSLSELGLDVVGSIDAVRLSQVQETFIINKSIQPYINIVKPEKASVNSNQTMYFEWSTYKGGLTTPFLYDLELVVDTPDEFKRYIVKTGLEGNSCEYNLYDLPNISKAKRVLCRIVARHPQNKNTVITMSDYMTIITNLGSVTPKYVDLGLPSGTLWADRNMGASQATEMGDYYAWGETRSSANGKTDFTWSNYSYSKGANNKLTKYCTKSTYGNNGFTDNLTELQGSDDAAASKWGYWYSIPTKEEWEELMTYCNWQWLDDGVFISSKTNDGHIYLPAGGYRNGTKTYDKLSSCHYWSSTLDEHSPDDAWFLNVYLGDKDIYDYFRSQGRAIRPVLHPAPQVSPNEAEQSVPQYKTAAKQQLLPIVKQENGMTISVMSTSNSKQ